MEQSRKIGASMLYRMYLRWAEIEGFSVEQLDYQEADEAGIKDVSFIIKGENRLMDI